MKIGLSWWLRWERICLQCETQVQSLGWEDSPGERTAGHSLRYSCPENPMDRGAWQARVHGVTKPWTRLRD